MTVPADIVNRALQSIGTRTTVSAAELLAQSSNEAIQANLILTAYRDQLLRMAPWDCSLTATNLTYLTSLPGTPENPGSYNGVWAPGLPIPPWQYEYAYPADCLRACWIIPQPQPFNAGVPPISPITTGYAQNLTGPPVQFKVAVDTNFPIGAPADQRVILTNQESACLMYCHQVIDPNVMDVLFLEAWVQVLAAGLCMALTGDKGLANSKVQMANRQIELARATDGNEGLSTNDVTPDWLRVRGYAGVDGQNSWGFDWGPLWSIV